MAVQKCQAVHAEDVACISISAQTRSTPPNKNHAVLWDTLYKYSVFTFVYNWHLCTRNWFKFNSAHRRLEEI
jgi:hypothetical protein